MIKNIGTLDRIARVAFAVAVLALFFLGKISGIVAIGLVALGAIFVVTSLIGTCPIYLMLGASTKKTKE